jgi:hypothetical protein
MDRARVALGGASNFMDSFTDFAGGRPGAAVGGLYDELVMNASEEKSSDAHKFLSDFDGHTSLADGSIGMTNALLNQPRDPRKRETFQRLDEDQQKSAIDEYKASRSTNRQAMARGLLKTSKGAATVSNNAWANPALDMASHAAASPLMAMDAYKSFGSAAKNLREGNRLDALGDIGQGTDRTVRSVDFGMKVAEGAHASSTAGAEAIFSKTLVPGFEGVMNAAQLPSKTRDAYRAIKKARAVNSLKTVTEDNLEERNVLADVSTQRRNAAREGHERLRTFDAGSDDKRAHDLADAQRFNARELKRGATVKTVDAVGTGANAVGSILGPADFLITKATGVSLQSAAGVARLGQQTYDRASAVSNAVNAMDVARGYDKDGLFTRTGKSLGHGAASAARQLNQHAYVKRAKAFMGSSAGAVATAGRAAGSAMVNVGHGAANAAHQLNQHAYVKRAKTFMGRGVGAVASAGRAAGSAMVNVGHGAANAAHQLNQTSFVKGTKGLAGRGVGAVANVGRAVGRSARENIWKTNDMRWARKAGAFFTLQNSSQILGQAKSAFNDESNAHVKQMRTSPDDSKVDRYIKLHDRLEGSARNRHAKALLATAETGDQKNQNTANDLLRGITGNDLKGLRESVDTKKNRQRAILEGHDPRELYHHQMIGAVAAASHY